MSDELGITRFSTGGANAETTGNTAFGEIDQILSGNLDVDFTSASQTITTANYQKYSRFTLINVATSGRTCTLGTAGKRKWSIFKLPATATNSVEIRAYSGTSTVVTIQPGQTVLVYTNGSASGIEGYVLEDTVAAVEPLPIGFQLIGVQTAANQKIGLFVAPFAFKFVAAMTGSQCKAGAAATNQTDFTLRKNGTTFVTIRFAASGTTATYVSGADTSFAAGDILELRGPATADGTLADVGFTLYATRTGR